MRFRSFASVASALAVGIATAYQIAAPSADAHAGGTIGKITIQHHVNTPPRIKSVPLNNVRDFGAVGNGVIDDSTAIQNAANNAAATGKGVFFPAGTYLHFSPVTFNGISVVGVGSTSVLISNNPSNCAAILTGSGASIQSMVISTQGLTGTPGGNNPNLATLAVVNAIGWTVASNTVIEGQNIIGLETYQANTGTISSNIFDGSGAASDVGAGLIFSSNLTVTNNLFQNQAGGVLCVQDQFIAIRSNTVGNVTYPMQQLGIGLATCADCQVAQNTVQLANDGTNPSAAAILLQQCDSFSVLSNNTYGGFNGVSASSNGFSGSVIAQNSIHNCGAAGVLCTNVANSAIQIVSNLFGECGLADSGSSPNNAVILINGGGADASGASTAVLNNSYQGHTNGLDSYVTCTFTAPHIPGANVSGNTQTQTSLPNNI